MYIRLHGSRQLYASEYSEEELQRWAGKIRQWDLDAYLYFDNDFDGFAVKNAERLREILSVTYKKFSIKNRQFSRMPPGIEEFSYDTEDRDQRSGNYG